MESASGGAATVVARALLWMTGAGHGLNEAYQFLLPALLPTIKADFGLSYTEAGFLFTSYSMIVAGGSLLSGDLGDRWGRRGVISGGFALVSVALVLAALSRTYWQLFLSLALAGLGTSTFHAPALAQLTTVFHSRRGRVVGIFQLLGGFGPVVMLVLVSNALTALVSWREILGAMAVTGVVFGPLFALIVGPLPISSSRKPGTESRTPSASVSPARLMRVRLILFLLTNGTLALAFIGIQNFIPTYLVDQRAYSLAQADYLFLVIFVGSMAGSLTAGRLVDRYGSLVVLQRVLVVVLPVILLLTLVPGTMGLMFLLLLFGFFHAGVFPPMNTYLAELTSTRNRARMFGVLLALFGMMGAVAPVIVGRIADGVGLTWAFRLAVIPVAAGSLCVVVLKQADRASRGRPVSHLPGRAGRE